MRTLFKTILLFTLLSLSLSASTHIDEYKVDLYYANGILIEFEKDVAEEIWLTKAFDLLANNPEQSRHIQDYKVAYNHSNGVTSDLFESFLQKAEAEPGYKVTFEAFKLFIATKLKHADDLLGLAEQANNSVEATDLSEQVKAYKDSIKNGHGIIVISHSLGGGLDFCYIRDSIKVT